MNTKGRTADKEKITGKIKSILDLCVMRVSLSELITKHDKNLVWWLLNKGYLEKKQDLGNPNPRARAVIASILGTSVPDRQIADEYIKWGHEMRLQRKEQNLSVQLISSSVSTPDRPDLPPMPQQKKHSVEEIKRLIRDAKTVKENVIKAGDDFKKASKQLDRAIEIETEHIAKMREILKRNDGEVVYRIDGRNVKINFGTLETTDINIIEL